MRIAIDVMGGDNAPDAILAGSLDAVDMFSPDDRLTLVGDEAVIKAGLAERNLSDDPRIEIEATSQVIAMDDSPVQAVREKENSSIVRMAKLGGRRHCGDRPSDVIISAGNTGACVAAAQMSMRRLSGIHRPGIAVTLPTFAGPVVVCDVGANPDPKPTHLHQYGHMAAVYAKKVIGVENPRVGLMSIGEEASKGNVMVKESDALMRDDPTLNYVGYIEGRGIFGREADVVVTEGFTGNVVLKLAESLATGIFKSIAMEVMNESPDIAPKVQHIIKQLYAKHDYHEYGGAPLLGANGNCLICHGSSKAITITNSIKNALEFVRLGINDSIVETVAAAEVNENATSGGA